MDRVKRIIELADEIGIEDIVDLDMYTYKNPNEEIAKLYSGISKEEFEKLLDKLED